MGYVGRTPAYGYFERQVESGDGSTTQFNLDYPVASPNQLLVSVDGIIQEPDYSYSTTVSSGQGKINFSEAPDSSSRIFIIYTGRQLLTATPNTASSYIDEFNGDGSTTAFTLTRTPSSTDGSNFIVYIDNVYQREGGSYAFTVSGSTITFTSAPSSGTNNIQVYQLATANAVATVTDGAVTTAKLANGSVTTAKINDGDVTLAKLASDASSGLITEIDQWHITADLSGVTAGTFTTNWTRTSTLFSNKGTGLSQSSGIFSFPSTGYYRIIYSSYIVVTGGAAAFAGIIIKYTTDNFSSVDLHLNVGYNNAYSSSTYANVTLDSIVTISDTTNQKIKFNYESQSAATYAGNSTIPYTGFTCVKIGEL